MLGGPGSGKGTQCAELVKEFGLTHLSAGDLLRKERSDPNSAQGKLIDEFISQGKIVPVDVSLTLIKREMEASASGTNVFLVDGFPRNFDNVQGWDNIMGGITDIVTVIFLDCSEEVQQERLLDRGQTSGRSDDNLAVARKRFKTFHEETMPVVDYFTKSGQLQRISADADIDSVYSSVRSALSSVLPTRVGVAS